MPRKKRDVTPVQPEPPAAKPAPAQRGRPSEFTEAIAVEICRRIAAGNSVRTIAADEAMPGQATIYEWLAKHEGFAERYARAREGYADVLAEEVLEIADDGTNDWMTVQKGGREVDVVNHEHVSRSKLRVETRLRLMEKLHPKKYGAMLKLDGKVDTPLPAVQARVSALLVKAGGGEQLDPAKLADLLGGGDNP